MHNADHCKDTLEQFSAYLDGELQPELCAWIEEHLKSCENCRVVMNTMQKTIELYHVHADDEVLPEAVRSRLYARLQLDEPPVAPA